MSLSFLPLLSGQYHKVIDRGQQRTEHNQAKTFSFSPTGSAAIQTIWCCDLNCVFFNSHRRHVSREMKTVSGAGLTWRSQKWQRKSFLWLQNQLPQLNPLGMRTHGQKSERQRKNNCHSEFKWTKIVPRFLLMFWNKKKHSLVSLKVCTLQSWSCSRIYHCWRINPQIQSEMYSCTGTWRGTGCT